MKWTEESLAEVRRLKAEGLTWAKIASRMGLTREQVRQADKWARRRIPEPAGDYELKQRVLGALQKQKFTLEQLASFVDRGPRTVKAALKELQDEGYEIQEVGGVYCLDLRAVPAPQVYKAKAKERHIRFGAISDTHLCSAEERLEHLSEYYAYLESLGIDTVYHCGDILDGDHVYTGHLYEVKCVGEDAQVDYVVQHYPRVGNINTYFITGNHCLSYYKRGGSDPGPKIAAARPDLIYLGKFAAYMEIYPGVLLYLLHQDGANPYAHTYRSQRIAAGFMGGEKPKIMLLGHDHQAIYYFERNIHIMHAGCFQAQTSYLKRKGIMPKVAGWVCEVHIGKDSSIERFKIEMLTWYA